METISIMLTFFLDMARVWSPLLAVGVAVLIAKMTATARHNAAVRRRIRIAMSA